MKIEFKQLNELAQKKAEKLLKEISLTVKDVDFDVTGADITMIVKRAQEVIHLWFTGIPGDFFL